MSRILVCLVAFFLVMLTGFAVFYVIAVNGSDTREDGNSGNPLQTITYALSNASGSSYDPETILITPWTYNAENGEKFSLNMKNYVYLAGEAESSMTVDALKWDIASWNREENK